jgi:hypothetical protein
MALYPRRPSSSRLEHDCLFLTRQGKSTGKRPWFPIPPRYEGVWGSEGTDHPFLTSVLGEGERSASSPVCFNHGQRATGTQRTGGGVDPITGLDAVTNTKNLSPCRKSNPYLPVCSLITTQAGLQRLSHCRVNHDYSSFRYIDPTIRKISNKLFPSRVICKCECFI